MHYVDMALAFFGTPFGLSILGAILAFIAHRVYLKKPEWKAYEGTLISIIKIVEKAIPDNTENKGLKKFDMALELAERAYIERTGKKPSEKKLHELGEGINIVHDMMESEGKLPNSHAE